MIEIARGIFYSPDTGALFTARTHFALKGIKGFQAAETLHMSPCKPSKDGYVRVRVNHKKILAHRLIWQYYYGEIPEGMQIDHMDRSKNNRLENLRCVKPSTNSRNSDTVRGRSKYRGVAWDESRKKWIATIRINGKRKFLGRYECEKEASKAYESSRRLYHNGQYIQGSLRATSEDYQGRES